MNLIFLIRQFEDVFQVINTLRNLAVIVRNEFKYTQQAQSAKSIDDCKAQYGQTDGALKVLE